MFEFKITLDDDDYLLFNQYHLVNSPLGKKSLKTFKLLVPFICFMFVIMFCIVGSDFLLILIEAIILTVFSIWWIVNGKKYMIKSLKRRINRMKKDGRLPYNNESILRFDDEIMQEITPKTETKTKYSLIDNIAVTEKAIYIYINSIQAYILPANVFLEETEKLKFLEFINSKVDVLRDAK